MHALKPERAPGWSLGMIATVLFAFVVVASAPAGAYTETETENVGTVAGVVKFAKDYPKPQSVKVDRDPATCGASHTTEEFLVDEKSKGLTNVVAILLGVEEGKPFPKDVSLKIDQEGCRYKPHIQLGFVTPEMEDGLELSILNSDDVFHNVHAYSEEDETTFNVPSLPGSDDVKVLPGKGTYQIKCDLHSWMSAYVVVLDHPYAAVSAADGSFIIEDVPPGAYKLMLWHEGLGTVEKDVEVRGGEESFVDFTIGAE